MSNHFEKITSVELSECAQYEAREELLAAQAEWEAEQYEWTEEAIAWEEGMRSDNLYDDDDPYNGEMWEDAYDEPADMYVWDCDLHNEF
jgi:hypothetical protein|tara:strand:- start:436 stop:702 length:267 start_codon:yes stop_codon:yes gene_type:complete